MEGGRREHERGRQKNSCAFAFARIVRVGMKVEAGGGVKASLVKKYELVYPHFMLRLQNFLDDESKMLWFYGISD